MVPVLRREADLPRSHRPAARSCSTHGLDASAGRQWFCRATLQGSVSAVLADGLTLLDAVKDLRTAFHDQAKRALEQGDTVPGYALSAGRAERHWRDDERTTIAALEGLGLAHDDIVAEELRSPRQAELRAKARGVKIPSEFMVSRRSGTSLVRRENAHFPAPGREELARSFSAALEAFQGGGMHD